MANAQDQAFTLLARQRGLLTPERLERAEALRREMGGEEPVAQVLLKGQLLPPEVVASLLRDLVRRTFTCDKCDGRVTYDALANLTELTCPRCGSPLAVGPGDPTSGAFSAVLPPGARPSTGRYPAVAPPGYPPSSGGYPAVAPPAYPSSAPSGGYPAVPPPSSGGYPAVAPPSRGGTGHFPQQHGTATGSHVARGGFHRAPGPPGSAPPSTGRVPPPAASPTTDSTLVRPSWTVEETVIDRNRRRQERPSETSRALDRMDRPSEQGRGGSLDRPSEQGRGGSLDRPSEQGRGGPLDRPSEQGRGGPLDRPSEQGRGRSSLDRPSEQGRGGPLDRPSEQGRGRSSLDRPSEQGRGRSSLDRPSEQGRGGPLDRPSEQGRGGTLDRPSEQGRGRSSLDRPSEGARSAEGAPAQRWDAEETVLEKHRRERANEPVITDTVKEQIEALPIGPLGASTTPVVETEDTVRDDTVLRPPLQEGGKLGAYTILAELGRGASGVIYLARRQGLERRFALKVLQHGEGPLDETAIARFQREAQVASRIQDPGIIGVFDIGREGDIYYYAMDYVPGLTLEERLQGGPLPAREAADVVLRLARSIHVAHEHGVVHRDLKPANVIVDETNGRPRITDFGVARDQSLLRSITKTGELLGTPTHMAPEQLLGEPIDRRVDVYALGVMLYECLTGKPPFDGPSALAVAEMACSTDPAPPRVHYPDLPRDLERICLKAMARERGKRHASAAELAEDLQRFLDGVGPPASSPQGGAGVPRWVIAAAAVSLALAAGVLLRSALVAGSGGETPTPPTDPGRQDTRAELTDLRRRLEAARDEAELQRVAADLSSLRVRASSDTGLGQGLRELEQELGVRRKLLQVRRSARAREPLRELLPLLDEARQLAQPEPRLAELVKLERTGVLRRRGQLDAAIDEAEPLVAATGPVGLQARMERALALMLADRWDEANRMTSKLAELDANGALGALALAWQRYHLDDVPGTSRQLERALQLDPDLVPALVLQSRIDLARQMYDQAERRLRRAEELAPDDPEVHVSWVILHEARVANDLAMMSATQAIDLCEPQPPRAYLLRRGILGLRVGLLTRALSDLNRVVAMHADVECLFWRGLVYLQQGERGLAGEDLRRAASLDPQGLTRMSGLLPPALQNQIRDLAKGGGDPGTPTADPGVLGEPRLGAEVSQELAGRLAERARRASEPARAPLTEALRLAASGAPAEAVEQALRRAGEAAPDDPVVALERARVMVVRELGGAARAIEVARAASAGEAELLLLTGELAFREGRLSDARASFDALWGRDKGPLGYCARARTELIDGRPAQAFDAAEVALSLPGGAPNLVNAIRVDALLALDRAGDARSVVARGMEAEGFIDVRLALNRLVIALANAGPRPAPELMRGLRAELDRMAPLTPGPAQRTSVAQLGLMLSQAGDVEALAWGRRALDTLLAETQQQGLVHLLAGTYHMAQDKDPAACLGSWRRARELSPGLRPPPGLQDEFRKRFPAQADALNRLLAE